VNNTFNQVSTVFSVNSWNNGSVGNYWSDYLTKYPNATQVGISGVWNTPYVIDANNIDHYPLMTQNTIPEFSTLIFLPFFMIATLIAIIFQKKKAMPNKRL